VLLPGQSYTDCLDLVAQVFQLKKEPFLHNLKVEGVVGKVVAHVTACTHVVFDGVFRVKNNKLF
jgi:hypothetical protein